MRVVWPSQNKVLCRTGLLVAAIVVASACQAIDVPSRRITSTPSSTPKQTPSPVSDEEAVTVAYRSLYPLGQRAEQTEAASRRTILARVATEPLLSRMLRGIAALRATDRVTWGTPVVHAFEVKVEDKRATLHDCQDATRTGQADARTGRHLTHGKSRTHLVATLNRGEDGVWRVSTLEQLEKPCSPAA